MNKREKRLLIIFMFLIIVVGGLVLGKFFQDHMNSLHRQYDMSLVKAKSAAQSQGLADALSEDSKWINGNEPKPKEFSKAMTDFQDFISKSARVHGLSYTTSDIQEVEGESSYYKKIQSKLTNVRGPQKQMIAWLCQLHRPSQYRAVTSLSIVPNDKHEEYVVFNVTVDLFVVALESPK